MLKAKNKEVKVGESSLHLCVHNLSVLNYDTLSSLVLEILVNALPSQQRSPSQLNFHLQFTLFPNSSRV